jgi:hypothetical protein
VAPKEKDDIIRLNQQRYLLMKLVLTFGVFFKLKHPNSNYALRFCTWALNLQ